MKFLKRASLTLTGILAFTVIGLALFLNTFNPNDYKSRIESQFKTITGKTLQLKGSIEIGLWPKISIHASEVYIESGSTFDDSNLLELESIHLSVDTLGLMLQELKMDALSIKGAKITLIKKENGYSNWGLGNSVDNEEKNGTNAEPFALFLGGVHIQDAEIKYFDQTTKQNLLASHINLKIAELSFDNPVDLIGSLRVKDLNQELDTELQLTGSINYDTKRDRYGFENISLKGTVSSRKIGLKNEPFSLSLDGHLRQKEQDITIDTFQLSGLGTSIETTLDAFPIAGDSAKTEGQIKLESQDLSIPLKIFLPYLNANSISKKNKRALFDLRFRADLEQGDFKVDKIESFLFGAQLNGTLEADDLYSSNPKIDGDLELQTSDFSPLLKLYSAAQGSSSKTLVKALGREKKRDLTIEASIRTMSENNTVHLDKFEMNALNTKVLSNLEISNFKRNKELKGSLIVKNKDLTNILGLFNQSQVSKYVDNGELKLQLAGNIDNLKVDSSIELYRTNKNGQSKFFEMESKDISINAEKGNFDVPQLSLSGLGAKIVLSSSVENAYGNPKGRLEFKAKEINPRVWIRFLGGDFNPMDRTALLNLNAEGTFDLSETTLESNNLNIELDDSRINSQALIQFKPTPYVEFDVSLDKVDLDKYLPPSDNQSLTPETAALGATTLPNELLRQLNGKGEIRIGKLKISDIEIEKINVKGEAAKGLINLSPLKAKLYKGIYDGNITIDARTQNTAIKIASNLKDLDLAPLIYAKTKSSTLNGIATIELNLDGTGKSSEQLIETLSGNCGFVVENGVFSGIDAVSILATVEKIIECKCPQPLPQGGKTAFTKLTASTQIDKGRLQNEDFLIEGQGFLIKGNGEANLISELIGLNLSLEVPSSRDNTGEEVYNLGGYVVPVTCSGKFDSLGCKPDLEPLLKTIVKNKAKKQIEKAIGNKIRDAIGSDAEKALKKLFKF